MAKTSLYNIDGKVTGDIQLVPEIFEVKPNESLIHQVYTAMRSNSREPWADTKNRGEVRGGGKKPWKQKGTGRARQGSIRAPQWKGGGVVFGPLSIRNYKQKINKKMSILAVKMGLTDKLMDEKLVVVENFPASDKTKDMAKFRKNLPGNGKSTLVLLPESNELMIRSLRNIPRLESARAIDLNLVDILHHQYLVISKDGLEILEKRLMKK